MPRVVARTKDQEAKRLVYEIPEAGAMLGLNRNAAYAAADRGDFGQVIVLGKLKRISKAAFHRKFDVLLKG
jgi:hypothetical protein